MKITIKIKDLLTQYVEKTEEMSDENYYFRPTFLCNFIKNSCIPNEFKGLFFPPLCETALKEMFSKYFLLTESSKVCATVSGWFVFNFENNLESLHYIKLIDGNKIQFSGEREHRNALRTFMMRHVVEMNPEESITFEIPPIK